VTSRTATISLFLNTFFPSLNLLLTYCSTSSQHNLAHARLRISAVSIRSRATECGEIGFDRALARINWELELRSPFCYIRVIASQRCGPIC